MVLCLFVVFFKQKTAYEMRISDWSSDVCSSDLRHYQPDPRADLDRVRQIEPPDLHHQLREHRHDDAEPDRVDEDRRDDEAYGLSGRHRSVAPAATGTADRFLVCDRMEYRADRREIGRAHV